MKHRTILFLLIMINFFFELGITIYTYRNSTMMVADLNMIYRDYSVSQMENFLFLATYINTILNLFQYSFGFYAIFSHRVTNYQIFNIFMLVTIFLRIFMSYINVVNVLMLVIKCFTYIYSRFVLTLLFRVLILPNAGF